MEKVRLGIIGLGIMGEQYVRVYQAHPLATVAAICDQKPERLEEIGRKYGVRRRHLKYEELLAAEDLDAVCIATPDAFHFQPARQALQAGKHVSIEKPLTTSLAEADELLRLQKQTGRKAQVNFNHRWLSSYNHGFQAIRRGEIGQPLLAYARKNDQIFVATEYISWAHTTTPAWFLNSHDIDLVRWFFQSEPQEVHAYGIKQVLVKRGIDTYDLITAQVKFASGAVATFESGWIYPNVFPTLVDSFVEVIGENGHLHFDRKQESVEMSTAKAFMFPKNFLSAEVFGTLRGAFPACLDDFVRAILQDTEPHVTLRDGRQVTATLEALHASLREGKTMAITPLPKDLS